MAGSLSMGMMYNDVENDRYGNFSAETKARNNANERMVEQARSNHATFNRLMQPYRNQNRQAAESAAHEAGKEQASRARMTALLNAAKYSKNSRKAKKEKTKALNAFKKQQKKLYGVTQNNVAGTHTGIWAKIRGRSGKPKAMTAKRMKKRGVDRKKLVKELGITLNEADYALRKTDGNFKKAKEKAKVEKIKKDAINAMNRQIARNKQQQVAANMGNLNMGGGPIVGPGLELTHSVGASKANAVPSAPSLNINLPSAPPLNNNTALLVANLPMVPTHTPVSRKNANNKKNKNNKRRVAVAMGGRRKTHKHKRRHKKRRKTRRRKQRRRKRKTRHRRH